MNRGLTSNNTSGFKGVSFKKRDRLWETYITVNKERFRLGHYKNIEDAIKARLTAEKKYFGEYAPQQHLYKEYGIN